jgi:hypothetical protein
VEEILNVILVVDREGRAPGVPPAQLTRDQREAPRQPNQLILGSWDRSRVGLGVLVDQLQSIDDGVKAVSAIGARPTQVSQVPINPPRPKPL